MTPAPIEEKSVYILATGAQTPVGRSAQSAAAAVRCGICAYTRHPFMLDKHGEAMVVAGADWLAESLPHEARITALAIDAAQEALRPLARQFAELRHNVRVHLALSADNLPEPAQRQRVLARIAQGIDLATTDSAISLAVEGHAGGLLAVENAVRELRGGSAQLCLVGGADSWLLPERLESLDRAGRIHSVHSSWGFVPGEGAGFCLLATGEVTRQLGLTPLAELFAVATAQETKLLGTQAVCIGEGLTAAFRGVLTAEQQVAHSYCDFNGETYRADEYGFAICRTAECFVDASSFTAAAECWGDVGAASGLLGIALPVAAWSRSYAKGPVALVWNSSATRPLRAAVLLKQWGTSVN